MTLRINGLKKRIEEAREKKSWCKVEEARRRLKNNVESVLSNNGRATIEF